MNENRIPLYTFNESYIFEKTPQYEESIIPDVVGRLQEAFPEHRFCAMPGPVWYLEKEEKTFTARAVEVPVTPVAIRGFGVEEVFFKIFENIIKHHKKDMEDPIYFGLYAFLYKDAERWIVRYGIGE